LAAYFLLVMGDEEQAFWLLCSGESFGGRLRRCPSPQPHRLVHPISVFVRVENISGAALAGDGLVLKLFACMRITDWEWKYMCFFVTANYHSHVHVYLSAVMQKCSKLFDTDMKLNVDIMIENIESEGVSKAVLLHFREC